MKNILPSTNLVGPWNYFTQALNRQPNSFSIIEGNKNILCKLIDWVKWKLISVQIIVSTSRASRTNPSCYLAHLQFKGVTGLDFWLNPYNYMELVSWGDFEEQEKWALHHPYFYPVSSGYEHLIVFSFIFSTCEWKDNKVLVT